MAEVVIKAEDIKRLVKMAGFDLCGVTRAEYTDEGRGYFCNWVESEYSDGLGYLHRNIDLRLDVQRLFDGAKSVIVCAINYKNEYSFGQDLSQGVGIASYATMRDYHKTLRKKLKSVLRELQHLYPSLQGRPFTDSAPLLEKHLAQRAGLGWIGRQSLLVTPQFGTFVLLAELVINLETDTYDLETVGDKCGKCQKCVVSCPVGAITPSRSIDSRLCIACRTIEHDVSGSVSLAGWIFGCDTCQRCCPHNQLTPNAQDVDMRPIITPLSADKWRGMTQIDFDVFAQGTPLKRASLEHIKANVEQNK